jgi:two-component system, OmpR family, heavy metal sensor histidine kinase CusS
LLRSCWDAFADQGRMRGISVRWSLPEQAMIGSSSEKLRVVFANLIDNALSYAPSGAAIDISARVSEAGMTVEVRNPTDGVLGDASAVFQPFWRGDSARSGGLHVGLGMTLVQRILHLLGGKVSATIDDNKSFVVRVDLPRGPRDGA